LEAKGFLAAAGEALAVLAAEAAVGLLKAADLEAVVEVVNLDDVDVVVLDVVVLLVVDVVGLAAAVPFLNAVLLVVDGPVEAVGAVRVLTGEAVLAVVVDLTAATFLSAVAEAAGLVVVVRVVVGLAPGVGVLLADVVVLVVVVAGLAVVVVRVVAGRAAVVVVDLAAKVDLAVVVAGVGLAVFVGVADLAVAGVGLVAVVLVVVVVLGADEGLVVVVGVGRVRSCGCRSRA